jgi:C4-dicarboxylate-specific signal transduction histidine kinase
VTGEWPLLQLLETTGLCKDGSEVPVELTLNPIRLGDNCIFNAFLRDITQRRKAEAELQSAQKQLVEASREAGMAEVATGVLHNVGNVLNSVNVSASVLSERIKKSKIQNVGLVAGLMQKHSADLGQFMTNDAKGRQLPLFLAELAKHLAAEQVSALEELAGLHKNIEHIKVIVAMQQSYAKLSGVAQEVTVTDLIEDAVRMNEGALARHDVKLVRDIDQSLPQILVDRHKVLQILINLIRNAKYACDDSGKEEKQLTLRAANGDQRVRISVIDNGVGIPVENLTRIFQHGFTTRKNGHGFGLHSGALAAKEMGGALVVQSNGPGQGASFTLELPVAPPH